MFKIAPDDPFHLAAASNTPRPAWIEGYFDSRGLFNQRRFKRHFLDAVHAAVKHLHVARLNPACLKSKISEDGEERFRDSKYNPRSFKAVVQTKIGACVQLLWSGEPGDDNSAAVYCSIDLVPTFSVESIETLQLAKLVNTGMLKEPRPDNWFRYVAFYPFGRVLLSGTSETGIFEIARGETWCSLR